MSIFSKLSEVIKDVANIDAHIDTDAAERLIRNFCSRTITEIEI